MCVYVVELLYRIYPREKVASFLATAAFRRPVKINDYSGKDN